MLTRQKLLTELSAQIAAGATGFYVQSAEEARLDELLAQVCEQRQLRPLEWNRAYGWSRFETRQPLRGEGERAYDLAPALEEMLDESLDGRLLIVRHARLALEGNGLALARLKLLLDRLTRHHAGRAAVVLVSERLEVPVELEAMLMVYALALPRGAEIEQQIGACYTVAPELLQRLASACGGLNQAEIAHALSLADAGKQKRLDENALAVVLKQKEQVIAKGGVLEMVHTDLKVDEIGGLANLKNWLERRAAVMHRLAEATEFGVQPPKGVLIAGMPGCGKSLTAKVTARRFGLPLLRLDIGSLLGKYVGESEHNMRRALQTAEAISPCVLWIDELEKAFVGMGGANASEVTSRLLGYFLTWMQEKSGAVFTIATANDITALPPELLRKGRFDEIFYVGFPDTQERSEILRIHLKRRRQDPDGFDIDALAEKCRDYTGADMENAVNEAMEAAFVGSGMLTQKHLESAIEQTTPLRETMQAKVSEYEQAFERLKLKPASENQGMSVAEMIRFAADPNRMSRIKVAQYRDVREDLLVKLATDKEIDVRKAVFGHPRCPESVLAERIAQDRSDTENAEVFALACAHPKAPVDLLAHEIEVGKVPDAVLYSVLRVTPDPERILIAAGFQGVGGTPLEPRRDKSAPRKLNMNTLQEALAHNLHLSDSVQDFLTSHTVPQAARCALAANGSISAATQKKLAADTDNFVRAALAGARIPETLQSKLAGDGSIMVRKALATNLRLATDVQRRLANDPDKTVLFELAGTTGEEGLLALADHENDEVIAALLKNVLLQESVYFKLLNGQLSRVLRIVESLRGHPEAPDSVFERLIVHPHRAVRQAVCRNLGGDLDDTKKCRLLYDGTLDDDARLALADGHPSEQVLWALLDSDSPTLRKRACDLIDANHELSERFFERLPTLTNWHTGLIPGELLDNHQLTNPALQAALARHPDAAIRVRLARREINESVRASLQSDEDETVNEAANEGASLDETIRMLRQRASGLLDSISQLRKT